MNLIKTVKILALAGTLTSLSACFLGNPYPGDKQGSESTQLIQSIVCTSSDSLTRLTVYSNYTLAKFSQRNSEADSYVDFVNEASTLSGDTLTATNLTAVFADYINDSPTTVRVVYQGVDPPIEVDMTCE
jgi:hypothetical protein